MNNDYTTLYDVISRSQAADAPRTTALMSEALKQSLYNLVSSGCHKRTKERLYRRIFDYGLHSNWGIYQRVQLHIVKEDINKDYASYCAGQSYPDEIRTVRQCILED